MRQKALLCALVVVFLGIGMQSQAQTIVRQTIGSIGGSTATNSIYVASSVGQSFDVTSSSAGFQYTPGFIQPQQLRLSQEAKQLSVQVFPNPSSDLVNIHSDFDVASVQLVVTDVQGRIVYQTTITSNILSTIDCSAWTKGTYFVTLSAAEYKPQTTKLIIYH